MLGLAIAGLLALIVAAVTGSTPLAVVVIALAAAGIIQLLRDWRYERGLAPVGVETQQVAPPGEPASAPSGLIPDDFTPDISTDPDGPSSDARADQA